MDAGELSNRLAQNEHVVASMLLPGGKKNGHEWEAGSIAGEAGASLKVHLAGRKAGVWKDFATDQGGDLIDLSKGLAMADTLAEIRDYLGVKNEPRFYNAAPRTYRRPDRPVCQTPQSDVLAYLTQTRKLSPEIINAYQIGERGRDIVYPSKHGGELVAWKQIGIDRDEKGKKRVVTSRDSEPCLFRKRPLMSSSRKARSTP